MTATGFPTIWPTWMHVARSVSPIAPVDLVGHSMGGNVAMLYAGVRPQRVRRLVSLEGFGMTRTTPDQAPARYREWLDEVQARQQFLDLRELCAVRTGAGAAQSAHGRRIASSSSRAHGVAARRRPDRTSGRSAPQTRRIRSCISAIRQRRAGRRSRRRCCSWPASDRIFAKRLAAEVEPRRVAVDVSRRVTPATLPATGT